MADEIFDVVVIGAGLAGLSAAIEASDAGAKVVILEAAPEDQRGGNSRFSNGAMRAVYHGVEDIVDLVGELSESERKRADFGAYSRDEYIDHMSITSQYRSDPDLMEIVIDESRPALLWLRKQGVRFLPLYEWHPVAEDGTIRFSGGSAVEAQGGGYGVSEALFAAAAKRGIQVHYQTRAMSLIMGDDGAEGVEALRGRRKIEFRGRAVVVASGGFEANTEWRTRYIGPGWDLAKVRGSRFNVGDGLRMTLEAGAVAHGNWSGCHSASWDINAPDFGDLTLGNVAKRDDFVYGIMVNARGERFVDEGFDVRGLTYARMGAEVLKQPGQRAWQIYDAKVSHMLHAEYKQRRASRVVAETLEALAAKLEGMNAPRMLQEIAAYNTATEGNQRADHTRKDGLSTRGLAIPKSNWALPIDQGPFEAYEVTCGITFTFGGVKVDTDCQVLDMYDTAIPGLFAAGEMVGGIFYFNYPGGAGLVSAAVFGRRAGQAVGRFLKERT